jgi:septal ring factor EnvC (AmiA/AmiB activator)
MTHEDTDMAPRDASGHDVPDLERTDRLPILTEIDAADFADDAVPLEYTAVQPVLISSSLVTDLVRPAPVDLPALAESVRTVEERIARQIAEYEALSRSYERSRDAESAALTRAETLAAALTRAQSALAVEQHRLSEMERALAEKSGAAEHVRERLEEALRAIERLQSEARASREALEASSKRSAQLEVELKAAGVRIEALERERTLSAERIRQLEAAVQRGDTEAHHARREVTSAQQRAESYLELLRTRDWKRGFHLNLAREWDERAAAANAERSSLAAERDRLKQTAAALSAQVTDQEAMLAKRQQELTDSQRAHTELAQRHAALEEQHVGLKSELETRDLALIKARAEGSEEAQRVSARLTEIQSQHAALQARIEQLEAEAVTHEEEMTVLLAHLNEARKPVQGFITESKRLKDELAVKALSIEQLTKDNRELKSSLERLKGTLEEREFLIRRLERSESNNANVLGRLQTTIEKLGAASPALPVATQESHAELIRVDGESVPFVLARRTRIGRAPGCELQVDSSSVSRYHALLLKGPRDLVVEDLNSTNGVIVNGRKISRHILRDGDLVTIGDVKFRVLVRLPSGAGQGEGAGRQAPAALPGTRASLPSGGPGGLALAPGGAAPGGAIPGEPAPAGSPPAVATLSQESGAPAA